MKSFCHRLLHNIDIRGQFFENYATPVASNCKAQRRIRLRVDGKSWKLRFRESSIQGNYTGNNFRCVNARQSCYPRKRSRRTVSCSSATFRPNTVPFRAFLLAKMEFKIQFCRLYIPSGRIKLSPRLQSLLYVSIKRNHRFCN